MSVPKSERIQSQQEYIIILQMIEMDLINAAQSKSAVPFISDELVRLAVDAYNSATMYFEVCNGIIMGGLAQKKKYCKQTYWKARQLAAQINIMIAYRMRSSKNTKGYQIHTRQLLKVCNLLEEQLKKLNKEEKENVN